MKCLIIAIVIAIMGIILSIIDKDLEHCSKAYNRYKFECNRLGDNQH